MSTLRDIFKLTRQTDRVKIVDESHNILYIGYVGMIAMIKNLPFTPDTEVIKLTYSHELWDKDWKTKGLKAPLEQIAEVDQKYSDLEERIYLYLRVRNV